MPLKPWDVLVQSREGKAAAPSPSQFNLPFQSYPIPSSGGIGRFNFAIPQPCCSPKTELKSMTCTAISKYRGKHNGEQQGEVAGALIYRQILDLS